MRNTMLDKLKELPTDITDLIEDLKERKRLLPAGCLLVVILAIITLLIVKAVNGGGTAEPVNQITNKEDFDAITSVRGCAFQVNKRFVEQATAITRVSEDAGITKDAYYSYRDGDAKYILFNLEQLVVAAQRGTEFSLSEKNADVRLPENTVMGIRFTASGDKLKVKKKNGVQSAIVNAGVVVTKDLYGDFTGTLSTVSDGTTEWAMFVGVPGDNWKRLSKQSKKGIEEIAETLVLYNGEADSQKAAFAVSVSGDGTQPMEKVTESEQEPTTAPAAEEAETAEDEIAVEEVSEPTGVEAVATAPVAIQEKTEEKAYTSTAFQPLSIGDHGLLQALSDNGEPKDVIVRLEAVQTNGAEIAGNNYILPEGCHWEAAMYALTCKDGSEIPYVNVRIIGADGEALKFRGISYAERTFDKEDCIMDDDGWARGLIVYYPVPNQCTEYELLFGEKIPGTYAAYYAVDTTK